MKHGGGEQVEIVLRALPNDVPFAVRLQAALKYSFRSRRLLCQGQIVAPRFGDYCQEGVVRLGRPARGPKPTDRKGGESRWLADKEVAAPSRESKTNRSPVNTDGGRVSDGKG
jgi:hypothetical protein